MDNINWYPGHMRKTERQIAKDLSLVDAVIEILDARIPRSSKNPDMERITRAKPRVLLFNKIDLADPDLSSKWAEFYKKQGYKCVFCDCRSGKGVNKVMPAVRELLADKLNARAAKGMGGMAVRALVAGIPNVGKSSFINRVVGSGKTKVEDRPGVTRENRWLTLPDGTELMDTPGILWPKLDEDSGPKLAFTGAITDRITDTEELAVKLLEYVRDAYPECIGARYGVEAASGFEMLEAIGRRRGCMVKGGEIDTLRASELVLDDFRGGKIGRITLDVL
ncbi:MAG: ribosome biogenesis GTPase YlqF [Clostridia bacterium]|nr:ribosome biogenesis GTPase YlqF [Clostridia bacterium]MBR5769102.1 ribosome biogenesis GTPase YlqF [Clostridia bacterium]